MFEPVRKERGLARAIGVRNFNLPMLRRAVEESGAPIASVQVEYHPYVSQSALLGYLRRYGVPDHLRAARPGTGGERSRARLDRAETGG